jgi:cell division protein FtsB
LAVANELAKENVDLRAENERLHSEIDALKRREPRD